MEGEGKGKGGEGQGERGGEGRLTDMRSWNRAADWLRPALDVTLKLTLTGHTLDALIDLPLTSVLLHHAFYMVDKLQAAPLQLYLKLIVIPGDTSSYIDNEGIALTDTSKA